MMILGLGGGGDHHQETEKYSITLDNILFEPGSPASSSSSISSSDQEDILSNPTKSLTSFPLTDKTIVLDMDLTLICTIGDGSDLSRRMRTNYHREYVSLINKGILVPTTLTQFGGSGRAIHNDVIKRPGVDEFLSFCKVVFKHVILWSAGQASYVYDIVKIVLDPNDIGIFDHVYTAQDVVQCSVDDTAKCCKSVESENFATVLKEAGFSRFFAKPLEKITQNFPNVTLDKTIIIDDLKCNFLPNPNNGVLIPPFSPDLSNLLDIANAGSLDNTSNDYCLFSLLHFLADEDFLKVDDVRGYNLDFFPAAVAVGGARR